MSPSGEEEIVDLSHGADAEGPGRSRSTTRMNATEIVVDGEVAKLSVAQVPPANVRVAQDQDRSATFSTYYKQDTVRVVNFLIWLGASREEAADVAQESMTKAYKQWDHLDNPGAWVRTVASRELNRRRATLREYPTDIVPEPPVLMTASGMGTHEQQQLVLDALEPLPTRQRQILAWTYDGYTPAEIAAELRITPEAVRSSLMKARVSLRRNLKPGRSN